MDCYVTYVVVIDCNPSQRQVADTSSMHFSLLPTLEGVARFLSDPISKCGSSREGSAHEQWRSRLPLLLRFGGVALPRKIH